jgi:hypothetical protein
MPSIRIFEDKDQYITSFVFIQKDGNWYVFHRFLTLVSWYIDYCILQIRCRLSTTI